jgi:hypothetical protein
MTFYPLEMTSIFLIGSYILNGRLYDMSGESLSDDVVVQIWKMLYQMGKEGKLDVFEGE